MISTSAGSCEVLFLLLLLLLDIRLIFIYLLPPLLLLLLLLQVLKLELKEIREQQDLLFRFMNFLKQEGAVHVLQFCLTVGKALQWLLMVLQPPPRAVVCSRLL